MLSKEQTVLFSSRLRQGIERLGWTQTQLAEKSAVKQSTISRLLDGKTGKVEEDTAQKLALAIGQTDWRSMVLGGVPVSPPAEYRKFLQQKLPENQVNTVKQALPLVPYIGILLKHGVDYLTKMSTSELAWMLFFHAMSRAIEKLLQELTALHSKFKPLAETQVRTLIKEIDQILEETTPVFEK